MKTTKRLFNLIICPSTFLACLASCGGEQEESIHLHNFAESTLTWQWDKTSTGFNVTSSMKCNECGETVSRIASVENKVTQSSTCVSDGIRTYTAKVTFGEKEYTDQKTFNIEKSGHDVSEDYITDSEKHSLICEVCGETILEEEHKFGNYIVDIEPTYKSAGLEHAICSVCGYKHEREISPVLPSVNEFKQLINKIPNEIKDIDVYDYEKIHNAYEFYKYLPDSYKTELGTEYCEKIENSFEYYDSYFGIAKPVQDNFPETSGMGHANYSIVDTFADDYGKVLKMDSTMEGWNEIEIGTSSLTDAYEVRFMVYVPLPTDLSLSLDPYVSNVYNFTTNSFTDKNGSQVKTTLAADTWTEFVIPAENFVKAKYFALFGTNAGTPYGVAVGQPAYISNFYFVKASYYNKLSIQKITDLISALPETSSINAYCYSDIQTIEKNVNLCTESEKLEIENLNKFNAVKQAWENKYSVVYDPSINGLPTGVGGSDGSTATFSIGNDPTYGKVLEVNASFDSTVQNSLYFQLYFYGFNENSFGANDKLILSVYTPFETLPNSSQSWWIGEDSNANKTTLVDNNWKEIKGTGQELNRLGDIKTNFANRAMTLQRYDASKQFGSFTGKYLISCVFAEKGN